MTINLFQCQANKKNHISVKRFIIITSRSCVVWGVLMNLAVQLVKANKKLKIDKLITSNILVMVFVEILESFKKYEISHKFIYYII